MRKNIKPYVEHRPWGSFTEFVKNKKVTVKILTIKAGEEFSLQSHKKRDEFWRVLKGSPRLVIADKTIEAKTGEEIFIPRGSLHRISARDSYVEVLEISFGKFEEGDIQRFEDKYGRVGSK